MPAKVKSPSETGKYQQAVQDWRHALVDDPQNGAIVLLLSQALFAVGQHVEAAGAASGSADAARG